MTRFVIDFNLRAGSFSCLLSLLLVCFVVGRVDSADDDGAGSQRVQFSTTPVDKIFVCVYADHLQSAADDWVAYRKQTGWDAEAIAISEIVGSEGVRAADAFPESWRLEESAGGTNQPARQLLSYLQTRFADAKQVTSVKGGNFAVLLLGDVNTPPEEAADRAVIPTFHFNKSDDEIFRVAGEPDDYATDHPYQLADFKDQLPDFTLGRVPAQTNAAALIVLGRIKEYEGHPAPGGWRKRINYIASEGRFGLVDKLIESLFIQMVETVVPYDFDITMTYANPTSPYCAPPSQFNNYVMKRLNEGALLVNYIGHGSAHRLDVLDWRGRSYPIGEQSQIAEQLDMDPTRAPILLIVACTTGMFDLPNGQPALAEAMLFHRRGPIAVVSGSRVTHPYPNAIFQSTFTEQLCQQRRATIGGVNLMATRRLIRLKSKANQDVEALANVMAWQQGWKTGPAELRNYHAALYNLLGDPATTIPYPTTSEFANVSFDQETGIGRGHIENVNSPGALRIVATLETARSTMAYPADLQPISGRDDVDLELKAAVNYEIANNFVLSSVNTTVDEDGNFQFRIADWPTLEIPTQSKQLWLKLAAYEALAAGATVSPRGPPESGLLQAIGSFQIDLSDH